MSEQDSEPADEAGPDGTIGEFEYHAQVTQHPTTIIEGDASDLVFGGTIDSDVEDTGSNFGVVIDSPEVEAGSVWRNANIPEGFTSVSEFNDLLRLAIEGTDIEYLRGQEVEDGLVEEARYYVGEALDTDAEWEELDYDEHAISGTDYKIVSEDDRDYQAHYNSDGDQTGISIGGDEFESAEVEDLDVDSVMVWYGGVSGQFVGRALDFNGMPFARYNEDSELIPGLFQAPLGWRGESDVEQYDNVPTTDRSELASKRNGLGRPPRTIRPPVLRSDLEGRIFVGIGRYGGGNMFEVHTGRALDDYSDLIETMRDDDQGQDDAQEHYDAIDMKYNQNAGEVLVGEFEDPESVFAPYHGEGWMPEPDDATILGDTGSSGGSFDTPSVNVSDDGVDHPTDEEVQFGETIAEQITGTGADPDDQIFDVDGDDVDLEGVVEANHDGFSVDPDVDSIREVVAENTPHLTAA